MCGRYSIAKSLKEIEKSFEAKFTFEFTPLYNIAPTLKLPVITNKDQDKIQDFEWSYKAPWNKKLNITNATFEKVQSSSTFSKSFKERRCIVIATSVFEWRQNVKPKQPYLIYVEDQPIFGMAGLWKKFVDEETGEETNQFTIITTTPNKVMDLVGHHRMPVILKRNEFDCWLNEKDCDKAYDLLKSYPANKMNAYPVSTMVNKAGYNSTDALEPIGDKVR